MNEPDSDMPEAKKCPQCGAPLLAGTLGGLCPACLLKQGAAADTGTQPQSAPFVPPTVAEVARLFPQLEILTFIGKGGMGAVYKARQPVLDRIVALKILPPQNGTSHGFSERFNREARALAKLSHPNIVAIYEFGHVDHLPFFIMEFVDGLNLRQLERSGGLRPGEALKIIPQICDALQFAHDEGVVHRDIKPENILLDKKGRVKIADFGIAKVIGHEPDAAITETKHAVGTPHYMAPEQVEKPQRVDHRADIFSLGVVFYEMLTGELPLGKFAPPSRKVQVDVRLDEVVLRALEKEPELRYQHASHVKTAVDTIAATPSPGVEASLEPRPEPVLQQKPDRLWRWFAVAAMALGVAIAIPAFVKSQERGVGTNSAPASASAELWSPTVKPDEKPDPEKIRKEAKDLAAQGKYEDSLQRLIWYFNHAVEINPALSGVRRSSGLSDWEELGRHYPKAKQALLETRDYDTRELTEGRGYSDMFADVSFINRELQDEDATYDLFKVLRRTDPKLARQSYFWAESLLVAKGEYQLCLDYMHDPQFRFDLIRQVFELDQKNQKRMTTGHGFGPDVNAIVKKSSLDRFVGQTRQLIEILVGAQKDDEAVKIRDEALTLLDDPRIKSAISDAREKIQSRQAPQQTVDSLPPVVVKTIPASGADDVTPGIVEINVTFSKEMADGSWSWSTAWEDSTPEVIGEPAYDPNHRTCTMKVKLEPGKTYAWWLNSEQFQNFRDSKGNPAVPYLLIFQTRGKDGTP